MPIRESKNMSKSLKISFFISIVIHLSLIYLISIAANNKLVNGDFLSTGDTDIEYIDVDVRAKRVR